MSARGPFDVEAWPERLACHVVDPGPERRIHGYRVRDDLASRCDPLDVTWLALRGELPTAHEREALGLSLVLLAPVHAGEAPAHATLLARIAGAPPHLLPAIAAVGLGEMAKAEHERLSPLRRWLDDRKGPLPPGALDPCPTPEAERSQRAISVITARWFPERALPAAPVLDRTALGHALLHLLGLDETTVLALLVWARLPVVVAEARHVQPAAVRAYPARLPDYAYVEDGALP
jgi:hypothetical protein